MPLQRGFRRVGRPVNLNGGVVNVDLNLNTVNLNRQPSWLGSPFLGPPFLRGGFARRDFAVTDLLGMIMAHAVVSPLLFAGVWQTLDLLEAVLAGWRRPQRRLVDTLYHRIDGCRYGYADVVELSNGRYELAWDVLDHCGMPGQRSRPVACPL